jgi:hypothetical protein
MKRMIFHLPTKLDKERCSGSQIRPQKMIHAFEGIGYKVDLVSGSVSNRKKSIEKIKENILHGTKYDFLYSESSTMPTALTESHHFPIDPFFDFCFLQYCKKQNIKVGLFYRDIYWMLSSHKKDVQFFKRVIADFFYYYDLKQYKKIVDILFVPTIEMFIFMKYDFQNKVVSLPPGIELKDNLKSNLKQRKGLNFIYVGGSGIDYDLNLFLKVLSHIDNKNIKLNLCTRKDEWENSCNRYSSLLNNVEVHHKNGEELSDIYQESDVAVYFIKPFEFGSFALGLKFFEYLSYEKPIIGVKGTAIGDFISKYDIGWSVDYSFGTLEALLNTLASNKSEIITKISNIKKMKNLHTWEARAAQVAKELKK